MAKLNLDEARRARQEVEGEGEPHLVTLGGRDFSLPATPPAALLIGIGRMTKGELAGFEEALRSLFGDSLDDVLSAGFEITDLEPIFRELYGLEPGESAASGS